HLSGHLWSTRVRALCAGVAARRAGGRVSLSAAHVPRRRSRLRGARRRALRDAGAVDRGGLADRAGRAGEHRRAGGRVRPLPAAHAVRARAVLVGALGAVLFRALPLRAGAEGALGARRSGAGTARWKQAILAVSGG